MAQDTSINLGTHFDNFVNSQLQTGRYNSAVEVICAGLRLLEEDEAKLADLRKVLKEGEHSEFSDDYSVEAVLKAAHERRQ